jgi:hypothetical protein
MIPQRASWRLENPRRTPVPCSLDIDAKAFRCREELILNGIPAAVYAFHREDARRQRNRAMADAARAVWRWLRGLVHVTLAVQAMRACL